MVVTVDIFNSWHIIGLRGKFIVKNLATIRKRFEEAEHKSTPLIAIDMSGVLQLDSSAVTLLVNFQRRIIRQDGLLVIFGLRRDIAEIFSIIGIDKMFRICSDRMEFEALYAAADKTSK